MIGKVSFPKALRTVTVLAVAMLLVSLAGTARAQSRASVTLEGSGLQVHPATYKWDGEIEPVLDPGANFYTFFYTGTVWPDGTVPEDSEIRRVAVSNLEWEQNRSAMVAEIQAMIEGGQDAAEANRERESIVNQDVRLDGNFEYVDTSKKKKEEIDPSQISDPESQAEWTFYYDQLVLWQYYTDRVVLNNPAEVRPPSTSAEERERQQFVDAINAYEGDLAGIDRADIYSELIQDIPEAETTGFSAATYFDARREFETQEMITALRDEFVRLAQQREDRARRIFDEMIEIIEARRDDRQNYDDWIQEKSDNLDNFVTAWSEVKDGRLLNFGQTYYLLTEEPLEAVPADARSVPVRKTLTPQDLIEEDGNLKPAQYQPGY